MKYLTLSLILSLCFLFSLSFAVTYQYEAKQLFNQDDCKGSVYATSYSLTSPQCQPADDNSTYTISTCNVQSQVLTVETCDSDDCSSDCTTQTYDANTCGIDSETNSTSTFTCVTSVPTNAPNTSASIFYNNKDCDTSDVIVVANVYYLDVCAPLDSGSWFTSCSGSDIVTTYCTDSNCKTGCSSSKQRTGCAKASSSTSVLNTCTA